MGNRAVDVLAAQIGRLEEELRHERRSLEAVAAQRDLWRRLANEACRAATTEPPNQDVKSCADES